MTRIIGDIHGFFNDYKVLLQGVDSSIQVGDFGMGFYGINWHKAVKRFQKNTKHRFIRGNHDSPEECKKQPGWIRDGLVENTTMYIGGAWSIDHYLRREGVSWWRDEELSYVELDALIDVYAITKPKVMITHDCPHSVAKAMFPECTLHKPIIKTRTSVAFDTMFEIHRPDVWFFGHWHYTREVDIHGTHFHCLSELDYIDFDLNDMKYKDKVYV